VAVISELRELAAVMNETNKSFSEIVEIECVLRYCIAPHLFWSDFVQIS